MPFLTLRRFAGGSEPSTTRSDIDRLAYVPSSAEIRTNGEGLDVRAQRHCTLGRNGRMDRIVGLDRIDSTPVISCDAEEKGGGRKVQPLNKKLEGSLGVVDRVLCSSAVPTYIRYYLL